MRRIFSALVLTLLVCGPVAVPLLAQSFPPEQQAEVSHVARMLGHTEQFKSEGMTVAPPRLVYASKRRNSKWGPTRPRRKI